LKLLSGLLDGLEGTADNNNAKCTGITGDGGGLVATLSIGRRRRSGDDKGIGHGDRKVHNDG